MADTKITALAAITTVDPAADVFPIVDVSDTSMAASGTTKKITSNQILGAGGTATLASATISGDLTVDTSTLKVDSANNRVGIGTASPSVPLEIRASDNSILTTGGSANFTQFKAQIDSGAGAAIGAYQNVFGYVGTSTNHYLEIRANNIAQQKIEPLGIFSWFDGAGGTRMTLNSTGLGVGAAAGAFAEKFRVYGAYTLMDDGAFTGFLGKASSLGASGATTDFGIRSSNALIFLSGGATERMRIDSSGNVIVNTAAVATTATDGFLYIPGCAGTPTGTPTANTGRVPLVVDTTNNKLYFYSGGAWVAAN